MNDLLNDTSNDLFDSGPTDTTPRASRARRRKPTKRAKPTHYKVICISMYTRDLEELDEKVVELKRRGFTRANKSALIRAALQRLDLNAELGMDPEEEFANLIAQTAQVSCSSTSR